MSNAIQFPSSKNYIKHGDEDGTDFESSELILKIVNNGYILEDADGETHVYVNKNNLLEHLKELL